MKLIRGIIVTPGENPLYDGALLVNQDRITHVDKFSALKDNFPNAEVIGNASDLVIPGFVNTHSHAVQTIFRGAADDLELLDWLNQVILPGEATLTEAELYASCRIGYAEMLLSGMTTANDMLTAHHSKAGMQAAVDSGIRGYVGKMLMDRNVPKKLKDSLDQIIKETTELRQMYPHGGRIQFSYAPRFIITCSDELMEYAAQQAVEHNLLFHTHAAENIAECNYVKELTGESYIHALHSLNSLGQNSVLAHCVWTDASEKELLRTTKTNISHNPSSNGKLASGVAPISEYLDLEINVGLASDGSPATGGHDMFLEMKLATFYQKVTRHESTVMKAALVFDMATRMGAHALRYTDVGELKEGFKADIVVLDMTTANAFPMYDPVSFIVYTATKNNIKHVFVDGKQLVENGKIMQDLSQYMDIVQEYARNRPFATRNPN